ncbi:MAG: anti-sigma factor family protein [Bryobacteraceae bacterium]
MFCPSGEQDGAAVLVDYCAHSLDPETERKVEAHLRECAPCRELARSQQAVCDALGEWSPAEISPDFDRQVFGRIERHESAGWLHGLFRPVLPLAGACAALLAALLLQSPSGAIHTAPQARVEKVDIEQAERALDDLHMLAQFSSTTLPNSPPAGTM